MNLKIDYVIFNVIDYIGVITIINILTYNI